MNPIEPLRSFTGAWRGTNRLHDPHTQKPDDSECSASLQEAAGGRFVRLDYRWTYQGKPQDGSLLIGYEKQAERAVAWWIDSWHMGAALMTLHGSGAGDVMLNVRGVYAAPPGPDWVWRIELRQAGPDQLRLQMNNITPDGEEEIAVETSLTRG